MLLTKQSSITGAVNTRKIDVDESALKAWLAAGTSAPPIQNAFPDLSDDDREFIMTGTTPEEWDEIFGDEEDDEDLADEPAL